MNTLDLIRRLRALPRAVAVVAAGLAFAATSLAPLDADAQPRPSSKKKERTFSFEDDMIETSLLRPETTQVETINKHKRASLIRIRLHFFNEIIRSAEDL
ncbi:MAG: hypothetical protein EXR79_12240 [Myxococcales bacterium]|nr:hypothetical protein [Myxococcales bacterium]